MRVSRRAWRRYQQAHRALQDAAKRELEDYFDSLPWDTDEQRAMRMLQLKAVELAERYGTADATLSAGFYDEVMAAQGASVRPAPVLSPNVSYVVRDVSDAVHRATSQETAKGLSCSALSGHVKRAGIRSMQAAAQRDHAQWAWVCIGDSCAFCRALGSQGWQVASRRVMAGSHADHIHDNCDCQFAVSKPGETLDIEGYDPDALLEEYEAADGHGSKGQINSMRRADYTQEFADQRNARRRELYRAARDEGESPDEAADA